MHSVRREAGYEDTLGLISHKAVTECSDRFFRGFFCFRNLLGTVAASEKRACFNTQTPQYPSDNRSAASPANQPAGVSEGRCTSSPEEFALESREMAVGFWFCTIPPSCVWLGISSQCRCCFWRYCSWQYFLIRPPFSKLFD